MRKSRDERRAEIIEATLNLAAEQGVRNTSTQAIADRVGIAQATVFRHFQTRDEIFAGALEWIGKMLFRAISGPLTADGSSEKRLRELIGRQLDFISEWRGVPRLLFSDQLHLENPALKRIVVGIMERYIAEVGRLIRDGQERGEFRSDLEPDRVAKMLIAMIQGLVLRWSLSDFSFPLEKVGDDIWAVLGPALIRQD